MSTEKLEQLVGALAKEAMLDVYRGVRAHNRDPLMILREFQDSLREVPNWTPNVINRYVHRFKDGDKVMSLWSTLSMPGESVERCIHGACVSSARKLWRQPQLVYHNVSRPEYVSNMRKLNDLTCDCSRVHIDDQDKSDPDVPDVLVLNPENMHDLPDVPENMHDVPDVPENMHDLPENMQGPEEAESREISREVEHRDIVIPMLIRRHERVNKDLTERHKKKLAKIKSKMEEIYF